MAKERKHLLNLAPRALMRNRFHDCHRKHVFFQLGSGAFATITS